MTDLFQVSLFEEAEPPLVEEPAETVIAAPPLRVVANTLARIVVGDVRSGLRSLQPKSVHVVVTSPPYFGLRDYGGEPQIWGGQCCEHTHEWGDLLPPKPGRGNKPGDLSTSGLTNPDRQDEVPRAADSGQFCTVEHEHTWETQHYYYDDRGSGVNSRAAFSEAGPDNAQRLKDARWREDTTCTTCHAWRGHFGLEPSADCLAWARGEPPCSSCYVCHTRTILAELWRVLRDDGLLWWNLGDSYAGSGKGPTGWNGIGDQIKRQGFGGTYTGDDGAPRRGGRKNKKDAEPGFKSKDLMMIPSRVAMAAQADGWYLRSQIPWVKKAAMPESVTDRPSTAAEYVFLLAKSSRYFYDADAVRMPLNPYGTTEHVRAQNGGGSAESLGGHDYTREGLGVMRSNPNGRNRRNTDWFFETWQGLALDEDGEPLALIVNPAPFPGAHFAVFSPKLVDPMIKASTSDFGCCPTCGGPFERVMDEDVERGWRPTCKHYKTVPRQARCAQPIETKPGSGVFDFCEAEATPIIGRPDATGRPSVVRALELFDKSGLTDKHLLAMRAVGVGQASVKNGITQDGFGHNTQQQQDLADEAKVVLGGYIREFLSGGAGKVVGWRFPCGHGMPAPERWEGPAAVPCTVLDPFMGAGSTAMAASRLGRHAVGTEISPAYAAMSKERILAECPMFVDVELIDVVELVSRQQTGNND